MSKALPKVLQMRCVAAAVLSGGIQQVCVRCRAEFMLLITENIIQIIFLILFSEGARVPPLTTLARQISNRSFKNKPKTSPIFFFDDLLSSILFIINYLLPINEPHIYSLKYIEVILWKCQFFCP